MDFTTLIIGLILGLLIGMALMRISSFFEAKHIRRSAVR